MLRGRPALVMVFLCFVCLFALKPQPATTSVCTQDIIKRVQNIIKKAPHWKWLECRLYTPTMEDYQQNCPSSTLKCFADEIKVLIKEWEIQGSRLSDKIAKLATVFNQTESECRQCELLKEQNPQQFLQDLISTLQAMNEDNKYC